MSLYDNEIYRDPPESDPTLAKDRFSYGAEFYVVKPPQTTAQQDVPATEEAAQQERKPAPKKKSRIVKAMKLLASCVAAVAVVTTLAAPAEPVNPVEKPSMNVPADIPTDATEAPSTEATDVLPTTEAITEPLSQCEANGHIWMDASYQAPKTCAVCGETEGEALRADLQIIEYPDDDNPENTVVAHQYWEYHNGIGSVVKSENYYYDISGVLFKYELQRQTPLYEIPTGDPSAYRTELEYYCEEYDENGTVINTDHQLYDPETGYWIIEGWESTYTLVAYDESGNEIASWPMIDYADGVFTSQYPMDIHLVEGSYQKTFLETGNLYHYLQINTDGSRKAGWYYQDGSLEQSSVTTIDAETNTWISTSEYHPRPSADFAYHNEYRVTYDDNGNIVYFYHKLDDIVIEFPFTEELRAEAEYNDNGDIVFVYYAGENGVEMAVDFYYDELGRLSDVGGLIG